MGVLPVNANVNLDLTESVNNATETALTPAKGSSKWAGKILNALFGPWLATREGIQKCIEAQYEKVSQDILDGRQQLKPGIIAPISEMSTLGDACKLLVQTDTDCKAKRLEYTMREVATEMKSIPDEDISDEPLNQTFFNHWLEEAKLIDDDYLRKWWSKLLVEETCKPDSVSLRTLNVMKSLSRKDAETFERICQLTINQNAILIKERGEPLNGTYDDILLLMDAGLISQGSVLESKPDPYDKFICLNVCDEMFRLRAYTNKIKCYCHCLTNAGVQIEKYIKKVEVLKNSKIVISEVSRQNFNIPISLIKRVEGISDDQAPEIWNTTQEI